eukprot:Gb_05158 [translate_table: standard]
MPFSNGTVGAPQYAQNSTLEEVQKQLGDAGKPPNSTDMDGLLKNIWTVEESQSMALAIANRKSSVYTPSFNSQGITLSRKTVDEVWDDIQTKKWLKEEGKVEQRQKSFGAMSLNDFLVKAGVVREDHKASNTPGSSVNYAPNADAIVAAQSLRHAEWHQYQLDTVQQQQQQQRAAYARNPSIQAIPQTPFASTGNSVGGLLEAYSLSSPARGTSSVSPCRKRAHESIMEKTVERRHKRMIKNRESAARSRARKQAYTNELECEVKRLKAENAWLKNYQLSYTSFTGEWAPCGQWGMLYKTPLFHHLIVQYSGGALVHLRPLLGEDF